MSAPAVTWTKALDRDGGEPVTVWLFSLAGAGAFATLTPTKEDLRDLGGRRGDAARRFFARRSVLRHLVARRRDVAPTTVALGYDPGGAPVIHAPAGLFCSLSARGDLAAVALAEAAVGVDLEPLDDGPIPWAVLTEAECAWVRVQEPAAHYAAFLDLWTMKEAYLKARRTGLMTDPSTVAVSTRALVLHDRRRVQALAPSCWFRGVVDDQRMVAACVVPDYPP